MNLKTAARRLGVHYQTVYRWVRSGQLVAVKVGAGYEISDAALERFEAQRDLRSNVYPSVVGDADHCASRARDARARARGTRHMVGMPSR